MWDEFKYNLLRHKSFLIFSHQNPDGDAIGSALAMQHLLRKLGKEAYVILEAPLSHAFSSFQPDEDWFVWGEEDVSTLISTDPQELASVWLDLHDRKRLGRLEVLFQRSAKTSNEKINLSEKGALYSTKLFCIDHHKGKPSQVNYLLHDPTMSSTAALVYKLYKHFGIELDFTSAQGLYLSVATDTRQFSVNNTRSLDMWIAQECLQAGVHPRSVFSKMQVSYSFDVVQFMSIALSQAYFLLDGQICIVVLERPEEIFTPERFALLPIEWLHRQCRQLEGVKVWIILHQLQVNMWRISSRSHLPVALEEFCRAYGGGGHACAAGGIFEGKRENLDALFKLLEKHCKKNFTKEHKS